MRKLLLLLCLLVGWGPVWSQELRPVETPGGVLRFELGQVKVPTGTQWKSKLTGQLKAYAGVRNTEPPAIFLISVLHQSLNPGRDQAREMQEFSEGLAESYAKQQGGLDGPVSSQPTAKGCTFSFKLKSGTMVYGEMLRGAEDTLVFNSQGATQQELSSLVASFEPDPVKMAQPESLESRRDRGFTAIAWAFGIVNALVGVLAGLLAMALRRNFWRTAANVMALLSTLELVAGIAFLTSHAGNDSFNNGEMVGQLMGGMLISCALPVWLASRMSRKQG